jgi:glycosyltransferase involved in cell wall biosynthesis
MNTVPKVTVVIPVYNRAQHVAAAIKSILAQSFTDFELLLIDDGSTDESVAVLKSYQDPRIRVVCNERNLGIPHTRNRALALARGEYVAMLDSDDTAVAHRLARQVQFLDRYPDYAVIGSWVGVIDDTHRSVRHIGILPVAAEEVRARLLFHCSLSQSSIMARTAILRAYRYSEDYVVCSDFDLWVRLARHYRLANLPEFLVTRRLHASRVTAGQAFVVKQKKSAIFRAQLAELGVPFNDSDIERHFLLLRLKNSALAAEPAYLDWADMWLQTLQAANARLACYPDPVFRRVLGEIWLAACWQVAACQGSPTWRHFWQSPLRRALWPSVRTYVQLWISRRFPHQTYE